MARYHVNPVSGSVGQCRAQQTCPFGGAEEHFDSKAEAMGNYEAVMASMTLPPPTERADRITAQAEKETLVEFQKDDRAEAYRLAAEARYEEQAAVEAKVAELLDGMKDVGKKLRESFKADGYDDFPDESPLEERFPGMAEHQRVSLINTFSKRTGEPLPATTLISIPASPGVPATEGMADQLASALGPGSYEGTFYDQVREETRPAYVGVLINGTASATMMDSKDDLPYRKQIAHQKQGEVTAAVASWERRGAQAAGQEEQELYSSMATVGGEVIRTTDWTDPDSAALALDRLQDLSDDLDAVADQAEEKGQDEKAALHREAVEDFEKLMDDAYTLVGHQKLHSR